MIRYFPPASHLIPLNHPIHNEPHNGASYAFPNRKFPICGSTHQNVNIYIYIYIWTARPTKKTELTWEKVLWIFLSVLLLPLFWYYIFLQYKSYKKELKLAYKIMCKKKAKKCKKFPVFLLSGLLWSSSFLKGSFSKPT